MYLIWGSTYLGIRYALVSYPPFMLAAIRFAIAGVLLFGVLRLRGIALPTPRQWKNAAIVGTNVRDRMNDAIIAKIMASANGKKR